MTPLLTLRDAMSKLGLEPTTSCVPLTFEELDVRSGFVLYETVIDTLVQDPAMFGVEVYDRGYVFVDGDYR